MYKQKVLKFNFLVLFCALGFTSFSQITTNTTQGCAPLNVFFSISGNPSSPSWTFGVGQGTSLQTGNVSHIYTTPGTYNVTYTAIIGGSPVNYNTQITVHPNPTGNISVVQPPLHCAPMQVSYTGSGGSAGSTYYWVFSDLTSGTGSTLNHTYNVGGNFTTTMTITDGVTGCNGVAYGSAVHVSTPPVVSINANPGLSACTAPFTPFLGSSATSGSPLTGNLTYNWTFGNSTPPSALANPGSVTYGQGQFPLTLTVTDDNNCSTTISTQVSVTQPSLSVVVPPVVCFGKIFQVSVNASQVLSTWSKGDNTVESFTVPGVNASYNHTLLPYFIPGPKNLVVSITAGTCTAVKTATTFVEQVVPSFSATAPNISCGPTMTCQYINGSTTNYPGATLNYVWTSMGYQTNPASYNHATYTVVTGQTNATFSFYQNSLNPYTIYANLIPAIALVAQSSSPAQCSVGIVQYLDTLIRPTAFFNKSKKEGCAPLEVTFRDTSFTHLPDYPIIGYSWNSGTTPATVITGVLTPPATITPHTFTYTSPGTYTPFLTIQTAQGCSDVSFIDTVTVVGPPSVSVSFATNTVCAGQALQIHLRASPTQTAIDHWHVFADNGYFWGCVNDSAPTYVFTHVGTHAIGAIAYQNRCGTSTVSPQQITVKGPFGRSAWATDCANPTQVTFSNILEEVQTATLNFGDGSPNYTVAGNPNAIISNTLVHTYTPSPLGNNNYTVTLTSKNLSNPQCGTNTFTMQVKVRLAQAVMYVNGSPNFPVLPAPLVCTNHNVNFDGAHSIDADIGCSRGYQWYLSYPTTPTNRPPTDSSVPSTTLSFASPGTYTLTLKIRDENDCPSSVTRVFRVSSAPPAFHFSVNPNCLSNNPVKIINTTTTTTLNPDPYTSFSWNFGDGTSSITTTLVTDVPTHSYLVAPPPSTVYFVTGTATNTFGCVNSAIVPVKINNPLATFYASSPVACIPQPIVFTALSPQNAFYSISYSDSTAGPVTTIHNTMIHSYQTAGVHSATLLVTDSAGCKNSYVVPSFSVFVTPVASFTTYGISNFCAGFPINYTSTSTSSDPIHSPITSYIWDIGGAPFANNTPTAPSILPAGLSIIGLTVSPYYPFCQAHASISVYGYSTTAHLNLNKQNFCIGDTIVAYLTDITDVDSWIINVGFGIQPSLNPVSPFQSQSYTYTNTIQTGTAPVIATVNSPHDACTFVPNQYTINIVDLDPSFKRNLELSVIDSVHCIKLHDVFTHAVDVGINPLSYTWDFGNGSTTTSPNPVYTYTTAGVWPVHLTVKDLVVGCVESSVKNMTINPLPTATVFPSNNCPDKTFTVTGAGSSGVVSGTWSPAQQIIGSPVFTATGSTFTVASTASVATTLSVNITDNAGCVSEVASATISIQPLAHPVNRDTTVIIGQTVNINMYEPGGFTYSWTPLITDLDCTTCYNPTSSSTVDITYTVLIADTLGCAEIKSTYKISIEPKTSVDVPTAFTPNGDMTNDIVYVGGWGIKKLNYFKIYNRWGQLLFESNDLKIGWDGNFNGIPQNMETYVYQVSVDTYVDDKPILKSGTVKIIR